MEYPVQNKGTRFSRKCGINVYTILLDSRQAKICIYPDRDVNRTKITPKMLSDITGSKNSTQNKVCIVPTNAVNKINPTILWIQTQLLVEYCSLDGVYKSHESYKYIQSNCSEAAFIGAQTKPVRIAPVELGIKSLFRARNANTKARPITITLTTNARGIRILVFRE
jgi:hypothetical protein